MRTRPRFASGFTLLEVLISSAILLIVIALLIVMADHTTHIWHQGESRRDASRELRAGLEILTEDLHSAVLTTNPSTLSITKNENLGSRLFFTVSHPSEKRSVGNEGDLCATGYFIARDPHSKDSGKSYNLYRFHASGNSVANAFKNNSLPALYASASATNAATTELLARHLIQLDVRPLQETASSERLLQLSLIAPRNANAIPNGQPLRDDQQVRFTTIVRLPPLREQSSTNSF
jgi:prepilin-type N-terminal cleavage/methylation domain-containing protein